MTIRAAAAATDTGRKRRRNEDAYVCEPPLFAVADGMGGAQAGEVASRLAAAALREDVELEGGPERVEALISEANRRIWRRSTEDPAAMGMGTTVTVALVGDDDSVVIGHVGDSRAYLIRNGSLEQLTDDHSLVGELQRSGKLSEEEARTHPQRSVVTRVLGTEPEVEIDTFTVAGRTSDVYLICSDGLNSMLDDAGILDAFAMHGGNLDAAARELVRAANRSGGEDNITVVCFELGEVEDELERTREDAAPEEDTLDGTLASPAAEEPERRRRGLSRWFGR